MTNKLQLSEQSPTAYSRPLRRLDDLPTVSVLCHCHNHETFVKDTIERILAQETDYLVELIVHDDASSDGSPGIVRELAKEHGERIVPILQETNQLSQGRRPPHFTFPRAKGEFIALCEGDDYWTDPKKLQKQVDALRRYPQLDLCVHPAMRLCMRTGKQTKAFAHGTQELVVPVKTILARHNQFAPTASMLMRTSAAQNLPEWFFNAPDLPVGDCFIESILGRKGTLYVPQIMSTYRRGVPGSYTHRFEKSAGQSLENSLDLMLDFTERLRSIEGIPEDALDQRLSYIRLNYALQFLAMRDRARFDRISRQIQLRGERTLSVALATMRQNRLAFEASRQAFLQLRRLKG